MPGDVTFRVTWSDDSSSVHTLALEDCRDDIAVLREGLGHKLADYFEDEWPMDEQGRVLGWRAVEILDWSP
jgi:hypothetical protein